MYRTVYNFSVKLMIFRISSIYSAYHVNDNVFSSTNIICCRYKKSQAKERKCLEEKISSMLIKKSKPTRVKRYESSTSSDFMVTSATFGGDEGISKLKKSIVLREKMLSTVLLRELQEIVDSGVAGESVANLDVRFNSAVLKGKHSCIVHWETKGDEKDIEICKILRQYAGRIRHIIMHSHVLGYVPKFYFQISRGAKEMTDLNTTSLLSNKDFVSCSESMTDLHKGFTVNEETANVSTPENDTPEANDMISSQSLLQNSFGIDYENLLSKIREKKHKNCDFHTTENNQSFGNSKKS